MTQRRYALLCSVGMVAALILLYALSNGSARSILRTAGFASFAAAVWLWTLDLWFRLPRPKARIRGQALVVPMSRVGMIFMFLAFAGILGFAAASVVGQTVTQDMANRRGWAVAAALIIGPIGTAISAVMVVWRGRIELSPMGIQGRHFMKNYRLRWDRIQDIELDTKEGIDAVLISWPGNPRPFRIPGNDTVVSTAAWIQTLKHYRDHPEDRAEIGTQASLDRLITPS